MADNLGDTLGNTPGALGTLTRQLEEMRVSLGNLNTAIDRPFADMREKALDSTDAMNRLNGEFSQLRDQIEKNFSAGLKSAIRDGGTFVSFLDKMRGSLEDLVLQAAVVNPVLNTLFGGQRGTASDLGAVLSAGGDSGGLLGGFLDFFQARAYGGPVNSGQPYVVGERGPELFVPQTAGRIAPSLGGSGINITMNITTPDANSFRASQTQITAALADAMQRAQRIR